MSSGFCTKCGTAFASDSDRFCAKCGTARVQEKGAVRVGDVVVDEATKKSVRRGVTLTMILGLAGIAVPMFFMFGMCSMFGGSVEGTLRTSGPSGGWTFVPTGCESMQAYGRAGANIHGEGPNDGAVYVTVDPVLGTKVDVEIPGSCRNADGTECTLFAVTRDRCTQWDVDAHFTGTVVNDVRQYAGHALLSCVLEDGTVVEADLRYSGC